MLLRAVDRLTDRLTLWRLRDRRWQLPRIRFRWLVLTIALGFVGLAAATPLGVHTPAYHVLQVVFLVPVNGAAAVLGRQPASGRR